MQNAPGVGHVQHHLVGQLCRLDLLDPQDLVRLGVSGVLTGDITGGEEREKRRKERGRGRERTIIIIIYTANRGQCLQLTVSILSPELDEACSCQDGAHGPLGYLAAVVLELRGEDSPSLGVKLFAPVHPAREL